MPALHTIRIRKRKKEANLEDMFRGINMLVSKVYKKLTTRHNVWDGLMSKKRKTKPSRYRRKK